MRTVKLLALKQVMRISKLLPLRESVLISTMIKRLFRLTAPNLTSVLLNCEW